MRQMALVFAAASLPLAFESAAGCEAAMETLQTAALTTPAVQVTAPAPVHKLPTIESLTVDSDFTVFMQPGVDTALRTAALRKLWRLNPVFSRSDGLDSDAEDWTR